MTRRRTTFFVVALSIAAWRCTALTVFDPEGQPCEMNVPLELSCLVDAGYFCSNGVCTKLGTPPVKDASVADAGRTDGGTDGGRADSGVDAGSADAGSDGGSDAGAADGGDGG